MIGYLNILKAQRKIAGFLQNLISVKYSGTEPTGMIDEVGGNDTGFVKSSCYKGILDTGYILDAGVTLTAADDWKVVFDNLIVDTPGNYMLLTKTDVNNRYIQLTGSDLRVIFAGAGLVNFSELDANILADELFSLSLTKVGTTFTAEVIKYLGATYSTSLEIPTYADTNFGALFFRPTDGGLGKASLQGLAFNASIYINGVLIHNWTFSEPMKDVLTHTSYDIVGGNNATLSNGSSEGKQDFYHPLQKGYLDDGINQVIPIKLDGSAFADGTPLTDPNAKLQDGTKWLNDGSKMVWPEVAELIAADIYNVLFDVGGNAKEVTQSELSAAITAHPEIYGGIVTSDYAKTITIK